MSQSLIYKKANVFKVDDSEVNEDESMETTTTANETPEVRTVVLQYNLP